MTDDRKADHDQMRPLKMRCQLCHEEEAARICTWLETGDDLPVGRNCLLVTGMIGRPLPQVENIDVERLRQQHA